MYTQVKSVSMTHDQVEKITEFSITKGITFSKAIQFIVDDFLLKYSCSTDNKKNDSELHFEIKKNSEIIFSLIEELELLKKMILFTGCHISKNAEKNLLREFPHILE